MTEPTSPAAHTFHLWQNPAIHMGSGIPTDLHRDLPVQTCLALDWSLALRRVTREHWRLFAAALISVPFDLDDDWNVISRTILPLASQRDIFPGAAGQSGIVDVVQAAGCGPVGRWPEWRGAQAAGAVCLWRSRQPPCDLSPATMTVPP